MLTTKFVARVTGGGEPGPRHTFAALTGWPPSKQTVRLRNEERHDRA